jgi:hypothetical protein
VKTNNLNDYMNLFFLYRLMAMENYSSYKKLDKECKKLQSLGIDYSKSNIESPKEVEQFAKLVKRSGCIFGSIIFEALAVEAFINYYAANRLGNSYFEEHLDKLTMINKYIVITKLVTGKDFPKDNHIYERLQLLATTRNNLVHNKSVRTASLEGDQFDMQINKLRTIKGKSLVEIMDIIHGLGEDLSKLIDSLDDKHITSPA